MKQIGLTQEKVALVDDDLYQEVNKLKWSATDYGSEDNPLWYAVKCVLIKSSNSHKTLLMHRYIWELVNGTIPTGYVIDHKNHIGIDNRLENIRCVERKENQRNQRIQNINKKSSIYKGVSWIKNYKKWEAYFWLDNKKFKLGYFDDEKEAGLAYNSSAKKYFGEFACLNHIGDL
jgi:hypothetical protein